MSQQPPPPQPPARPLCMGKSVHDLNRRAERTVASVTSAKVGVPQLMKLYIAAERAASVQRDEERAYVLYTRMLLVFNRISRMHDFAGMKFQHFQELQRASDEVERLNGVLTARYKTSKAIRELQGFESLTKQMSIADRKQVQPSSATVNRRQSSVVLGLSVIGTEELVKLLQQQQSLAVLDLRSREEFASCRLKHDVLVSIDASDLRPGFTKMTIEQLVLPTHMSAWQLALAAQQLPVSPGTVPVLVLAWTRSSTQRLARAPNGAALILCSALSSAAPSSAAPQLRLLAGGLKAIASTNADLFTNPLYRGPAVVGVGGSHSDSDSSDALLDAVSTQRRNWVNPAMPACAANESAAAANEHHHQPGQLLPKSLSLNSLPSSTGPDALSRLEPNSGPVDRGLTGLRNLGNSCYINSVLQCLSNTPLLAAYFLDGTYRGHVNPSNPLGHRGQLASRFALLCWALWSGTFSSVSPADLREAVDSGAFDSREQQDAQEFLLLLLDGLHEDLNRARRRLSASDSTDGGGGGGLSASPSSDCSDVDGRSGPVVDSEVAWARHRELNDSIIVDLFHGQFKSSLICDHCQLSSVTFDAFMYFSVPVVGGSRCTLNDCLVAFLQPESLSGSCQWFCPGCRKRRDAVKKIDLWRLPPCLLIHLKRFRGGGGKISSHVDFPLVGLDLRCHCQQGPAAETGGLYNLCAVCNHYGSSESGHYTAACLNAPTSAWHKFDDDSVSDVSPDEVATPAGYILFYCCCGG